VLVIDVGGTPVKILATGQDEHRSFASGPPLTPGRWYPASRNSLEAGTMTRSRSAIPARFCTAGRLPSRTTLRADGLGSISRPKQSHYAFDPKILAENPPADIELAKIGDLLNCDLAVFLKKQ
jgi:hypothetical protein